MRARKETGGQIRNADGSVTTPDAEPLNVTLLANMME